MAKMKAAQLPKAGADFQIVERDIPEPGPGHVRIRLQACGVCHSDALAKEGGWPGLVYPRVPGHEVQSAWPRVPGDGSGRPAPSARHALGAAGDRGPWVSLPLRATIPEGNTVGQHADIAVT